MAYRIQSGDTLWALSQKFGTSVDALLKANPQITNRNLIYTGQMLNVPGKSDGFQAPPPQSGRGTSQYRIQSGDTLWAIAMRYATTVDALMAANPSITNRNLIYTGQMLTIPGGGGPAVPGVFQPPASGRVGPPSSFVENAWGGQCLAWVNKTSGRPMWNYCAKDCLTNHPGWNLTNTPRPGELFVMANGQYGHIGYVLGVNSNGTITVADSNWNCDEREHIHTISMSSIAGYLSPA